MCFFVLKQFSSWLLSPLAIFQPYNVNPPSWGHLSVADGRKRWFSITTQPSGAQSPSPRQRRQVTKEKGFEQASFWGRLVGGSLGIHPFPEGTPRLLPADSHFFDREKPFSFLFQTLFFCAVDPFPPPMVPPTAGRIPPGLIKKPGSTKKQAVSVVLSPLAWAVCVATLYFFFANWVELCYRCLGEFISQQAPKTQSVLRWPSLSTLMSSLKFDGGKGGRGGPAHFFSTQHHFGCRRLDLLFPWVCEMAFSRDLRDFPPHNVFRTGLRWSYWIFLILTEFF